MTFSDDDLKKAHELSKTLRGSMDSFIKLPALLARTDAAEKVCQILQRFVERQEHAAHCRCDFCYALKLWKEKAGK